MKNNWFPDEYRASVWEIDYTALWQRGIRGIILDIDNTLLPYYVPEPDAALVRHIQELQGSGFKAYIVSNGKSERVARFNQKLKLPYVCHASKPSRKGFDKAMRDMMLSPEQIVVIGDQIFTDVWGGRRMGMYTVLVRQVSPKDEWITAIKRPLEKLVLFFYKRRIRHDD